MEKEGKLETGDGKGRFLRGVTEIEERRNWRQGKRKTIFEEKWQK